MLKLQMPTNQNDLVKQIMALEYLIQNDTNKKDREIHIAALNQLKNIMKEVRSK